MMLRPINKSEEVLICGIFKDSLAFFSIGLLFEHATTIERKINKFRN